MKVGDRIYQSDVPEPAPIRHTVILGHPNPGSFNHSVASRYNEIVRANYQAVEVRDLYAIGFDPLLKDSERPQLRPGNASSDVCHEISLIESSAVITFIYPLWFGTPPAIIKGYIDRVFGAAFALSDLKRWDKVGPFAGKTLCLFTSSASTNPWLAEKGIDSSLRQSFGYYLESIFGFSKTYFYHAESIVEGMGPSAAEQRLFNVGEKARMICAEVAAAQNHEAQ